MRLNILSKVVPCFVLRLLSMGGRFAVIMLLLMISACNFSSLQLTIANGLADTGDYQRATISYGADKKQVADVYYAYSGESKSHGGKLHQIIKIR